MKNVQELLDLLIKMRKTLELTSEFNDGGLCYLAECIDESNDLSRMLEHVEISWAHWPEYSGYLSFPVPHPTKKPSDAYFHSDDLYAEDTEYGQARRRLLNWLIEQCEIKLKELSNV